MVNVTKCQCGHPLCKTYGVSNGTFYQGCGWDRDTAIFVAYCFNSKLIQLIYRIVSRGLKDD